MKNTRVDEYLYPEVRITAERRVRKAGYFWRGLIIAAILLGIFSLVADYGFSEGSAPALWLKIAEVAAGVLLIAARIMLWRESHAELRWKNIPWLDVSLLLLLAAGLYWLPERLGESGSTEIRWNIYRIYLFVLILLLFVRWTVTAMTSRFSPAQVLITSFLAIVFTGSMLLLLPASHRKAAVGFTDAVFTATSATCVTGLVVLDTGGDFTRLGQSVILSLIQAGGLGIMIFGTLFAILLGSPLSLRESVAMRDIMNEQSPGKIGRIVVFICLSTFLIEGMGVLLLQGIWQTDELRGGQWFNSLFHAISAFCNAGFSLQGENLMPYRGFWQTYGVICPLIILGGLGFPVLQNLFDIFFHRFWRWGRKGQESKGGGQRLLLHSKIVLLTTAGLLAGGFIFLAIMEYFRPDRREPFTLMNLLDCWFNSVTARTAGFNTVDIGQRSAGGKLVLIFLMFVGGSPSSTAGGIKTTALAVIILTIYTTMRRQERVHAFHRSIPLMVVRRAFTVVFLYGLLLWFLTLLLSLTEHSTGGDALDLIFEVTSALGTVGLSTGVTTHLSTAGKWIIISAMLAGRLGPLSLLSALSFNTNPGRYEYPREMVVIG